jgi:hypothetical protein
MKARDVPVTFTILINRGPVFIEVLRPFIAAKKMIPLADAGLSSLSLVVIEMRSSFGAART